MSKKTFRAPLRTKAQGEGFIEAAFAKLEHWDLDNDYTKRGAFGHQRNVVLENWNHDTGLPAGSGEIFERNGEAIFRGRIFTETQVGKDLYETLRQLPQTEWSYTFDILDAEPVRHNGRSGRVLKRLDCWGVGPVTRGAAGPGMTRLLQLKSANGVSALSPSAFGEYVDGLLQHRTWQRLAETEKRVKQHAAKMSEIDQYRQELQNEGHSEALIEHMVASEVEITAQRVAMQENRYLYDVNPVAAVEQARELVLDVLSGPAWSTGYEGDPGVR